MSKLNKILVTGGAGFIGSHTVDLLLQQGHQVVVLDNLITGKKDNLNLHNPNLSFVFGDIRDYTTVRTHVDHCDAVLHLAALSSVPKSIDDPLQSLQVNTLGFLHVLQAIRELQRNIRLVFASSAAVYGAAPVLPCDDSQPLPNEVLSPYALEKANNERYATLYANLFGVPSLALRYFNVYGPRQDPSSPYSGVISKFVECYQQHQPITVFGDGAQSRDFIYVGDIARANLLALNRDVSGALNIATGIPQTLLDLIHCLEKAGNKPAIHQFAAARAGDIKHSYARVETAEKLLGFRAGTSLAAGIKTLL